MEMKLFSLVICLPPFLTSVRNFPRTFEMHQHYISIASALLRQVALAACPGIIGLNSLFSLVF